MFLREFPKVRPPLPIPYREIYEEHYLSNRNGNSSASRLSQIMESWMHKQISKDFKKNIHLNSETLEVGAGTLNHLTYEKGSCNYDVVEPFKNLYLNSPFLVDVRNVYEDIADIPVNKKYDRIISIAVLEHLCNLPEIVAKCGLLLKEPGVFRVAIPSEGTLLWKLGWLLTTGFEFKLKYRLNYEMLLKYEHVNTAAEIENILKHFFQQVQCKVFGISRSLSFYQFFECKNPSLKLCQSYIDLQNKCE